MFANNDQISWRQLFCQMVLGIVGTAILFLPGRGGVNGISGTISCVIAFVVLAIYGIWLVRIAPAYGHMERHVGTVGRSIAGGLFLGYFILTGAFLVSLICEITSIYMVSRASAFWTSALVILTCSMAGIPQIQRRARMAEFCFPFFISVLVIMIVLAFFQSRSDFGNYLFQESYVDVDGLLTDSYTILSVFACVSAVPFLLGNVKGHRYVSLLFALTVIFSLMIGVIVLLQGSYGAVQVTARSWPVLSIMAGIRIPGGFVSRMDPIWLSLLLLFLLFSLGSTFFYSNYIVKRTKLKIPWYIIYGLIFVVSLTRIKDMGIQDYYMTLVKWFFAPAIFLWNLILGIRSRRRGL